MAKETPKTLNLKNDIVFKTFFSRKGNEKFLIEFLSALLKIEIKTISIREEVNLEQLSPQEKGGRLDLQAELNEGIIVSIELQICNHHDMENRTTFYSSKVLSQATERGSNYREIKQVYMINILDYELLGFEEYVSESVIVLDKHRDYEVLKNYLTGDAAVRRLAELREKWEMDERSGRDYAKEEGIKEGKQLGAKEKQKEMIRKMVAKNFSIDMISEITELSKAQIEEYLTSLDENNKQ